MKNYKWTFEFVNEKHKITPVYVEINHYCFERKHNDVIDVICRENNNELTPILTPLLDEIVSGTVKFKLIDMETTNCLEEYASDDAVLINIQFDDNSVKMTWRYKGLKFIDHSIGED